MGRIAHLLKRSRNKTEYRICRQILATTDTYRISNLNPASSCTKEAPDSYGGAETDKQGIPLQGPQYLTLTLQALPAENIKTERGSGYTEQLFPSAWYLNHCNPLSVDQEDGMRAPVHTELHRHTGRRV